MLVLHVVLIVSDGTSRQSRWLVNQSTDRLREWHAHQSSTICYFTWFHHISPDMSSLDFTLWGAPLGMISQWPFFTFTRHNEASISRSKSFECWFEHGLCQGWGQLPLVSSRSPIRIMDHGPMTCWYHWGFFGLSIFFDGFLWFRSWEDYSRYLRHKQSRAMSQG